MKNLVKLVCNLLFNVDFKGAVDEAFCDCARSFGEQPADQKPVPENIPAKKIEIKKSYGITYIYDTHATIAEI